MTTSKTFTTPVGRFVGGSMSAPRTTDEKGQPLVFKSGPNAGKPRSEYFFAVAIAKKGEQHWSQCVGWGDIIWATGHAAFPNGSAQSPSFAWKVTDGDSAIPDSKGRAPNSRVGYPGHWVLRFSGSFAPKLCSADGSRPILEPETVKAGHYIQVHGSVEGNSSMQTPGVYLNHMAVAHSGFGEEIFTGVDTAGVGFGGSPLPPGASAVPVGGMVAPAAPAAYAPPAPGAYAPPPAAYAPPAAPAPAAYAPPVQNVVTPNPAFVAGAGAVMPPMPPGAVPPAPGAYAPPAAPVAPAPRLPDQRLTAAAQGASYAQLIAGGWTDATLVQNGLMLQA